MLSSNVRERSSRLFVLGLLIGLLVAFAQRADTQPPFPPGDPRPPIAIPLATPDLVVTVNAPAQIQQSGQGLVQIIVHNTLTPVRWLQDPFGAILGGSA